MVKNSKLVSSVMSNLITVLFVLVAILAFGCSGIQHKRSKDVSLEAPPPEDSPAVIAERQDANPLVFPVVDSSIWSASERAQTGVIFAWTIKGSKRMMSDSGCRLRVRNRESGDTVLLKIDAKTPVSIQPLKPGTWDAKRLGCGVTRVWDLEGLMKDGFVVKPNSMSVIGWFIFEFDDRKLLTVREGGRKENSALASELRSRGGGWPSESVPLISGFSGKSIPSAEKLSPRDEIVRVNASGLRDSEAKLAPLLSQFQGCASQGMKVDPLRAGTLKVEAFYRNGKFEGAKTSSLDHAMRDDLVQCLLQAHETFRVDSGGDFSLMTTY